MTDYATIIVFLFSFWRGCHKDLTDIFLGPVSIMLAAACGIWYYQLSQDLIFSVCIAVLGPIALRILLLIFQKIFSTKNQKSGSNDKPVFTFLSMISGCLNSIWGMFLYAVLLTGILLWPSTNEHLRSAQKDIKHSQTFALMQDVSEKKFPEEPISPETIKRWTKPIKGTDIEFNH